MSKQILVINSGSTSLKYKLFDFETLESLKENKFEEVKDYFEALKYALREIGSLVNIVAVGHRVVHGGTEFTEPTIVTNDVLEKLEKYNELAPLHNPYNLAGIKASNQYIPNIPDVAVFDTAFFKNLPDRTKIYALPYEFYKKYGIQRFGFHGISHQYVAEQAAKELKRPLSKLKLITCHLGGGCSVAAIDKGIAVDVSMGFTPMEGLMMMTRSGDLDAGVVLKLLELEASKSTDDNISKLIQKVENTLNFNSGIKGISDCDNFLDLLKEITFSNERARLAFEMFIYRIKKYIGAYYAILNGCDALVFTGAIGAGRSATRNAICDNMDILKSVKILVIPTDEELQIAREVKNLFPSFS